MTPVLIDTDPGIDDAVAIMFALRSGLDLRAVTAASGNLTADLTSANARKILALAGRADIPVAQGPLAPLVRPYPRDPFSHGDDGLANTGLPAPTAPVDPRFAPDVIVDLAREHPGELTVIALAPLTNIALALMREPELPRLVRRLVIIGGSFGIGPWGGRRATGDNPVSEWNVYVDPEAARAVFHAGFRLTAIGLDVATRPELDLGAAHLSALTASSTAEAAFLLDVRTFVRDRSFDDYCGLIDSLAVAAVLDPGLFDVLDLRVDVETTSELTRGQTIADTREHFAWDHLPTIQVAADADFPRFLDRLVTTLS